LALGSSLALLLAMTLGCSRKPEPAQLHKMARGAQFSGFLSTYASLKPSPDFENTVVFVNKEDARNVHRYFAAIVEPVQIYIATDADPSKLPDQGRGALTAYFQNAITRAMADAFPIVQEPGPLVLRMRTALIGVDVGPAIQDENAGGGERGLPHAVDIGKVGVEMEMVDSVTGEQIAAVVDRQPLGSGATVGSVRFSRDEKFQAAKEAFDGWAARLRAFLDSAHELSPAEMQRADESYRPYGDRPRTEQ
jgi:hypothetical protein